MNDEVDSNDITRFMRKYRISSINNDVNFTYETINLSYNQEYAGTVNGLRDINSTITLPLRELKRIVEMDKNFSIPNTHPAIREAYEQYLILRKLYE
jgi:hypothetical protein